MAFLSKIWLLYGKQFVALLELEDLGALSFRASSLSPSTCSTFRRPVKPLHFYEQIIDCIANVPRHLASFLPKVFCKRVFSMLMIDPFAHKKMSSFRVFRTTSP